MKALRITKYLIGIAGMILTDYGAFRFDPVDGYVLAGLWLFVLVITIHYLENELVTKVDCQEYFDRYSGFT